MRIRIDFAELRKHLGADIIEDANMGEVIENYINDWYFNGADKACIYLGINYDVEYVELDLISG